MITKKINRFQKATRNIKYNKKEKKINQYPKIDNLQQPKLFNRASGLKLPINRS